jgi:tetratricopeptide (TPR) repeat protein
MSDLRIAQLLGHATRLMRGGHTDQAIDVLTRILGEAPDFSDAHAYLAVCLVSRHRLHAAQLEASQALLLDPDSEVAHMAMAAVSIAHRKFREAEAHLEAAHTLSPEDADILAMSASLYQAWDKPDQALDNIARAHAMAPDDPGILAQYGRIEFLRGRREPARGFAERALEIDPEHVDALTLLGHCDLAAGRVEDARRHAVWALQNAPGDEGALTLLAAVKARQSWFLGLWWRFQTWISAGSNRRAIALLVGMYLLYRAVGIALVDNGQQDGASVLSVVWLGFCVYTWFAPSIFQKSVRRELETVRLRPDY